MSGPVEEAWYANDHVTRGHAMLERAGYPDLTVGCTASAGCDENDVPQVLIFGPSHVAIRTEGGGLLLDVGHWEVRGVRPVHGSGIQVCITGMGEQGLRQERWMHRISDADAEYLEKVWLTSSPRMCTGLQLNSLPWREEGYAYYVGRVVTESARCDVTLAGVVHAAQNLLGRSAKVVYGASGVELAEALDRLGSYSEAFRDVGERYRAWYQWRNFSIHGVRGRDSIGHPTSQVLKVNKAKRGKAPEVLVDVQDQNFLNLALLWRAFYALNIDASHMNFSLLGNEAPEQILKGIPLPNMVSPEERMPPETSAMLDPS